jgi:succinate dehydrogenase hydrophobic anchor subunit
MRIRELGVRSMKPSSLGKGRKKVVKKFTARNGLWMMLLITAAVIIMLILWLVGFFRLDVD